MNFTEILDFESNKLLELFTLLRVTMRPISIMELTTKLNVDKKTTLRYIDKLTVLFETYKLDRSLDIIKESKNKIMLGTTNDLNLELFKMKFLKEIPEIVIIKNILDEQSFQVLEIAKKLSISESSVRKKIQKINKWLKNYHLKLKRGSYQLIGSEIQIREFIFHFHWLINQGMDNELLINSQHFFDSFYDQLIHFFQMKLNASQKDQLFCFFYISFKRNKLGYSVQLDEKWHAYLSNSFLFDQFMKVSSPYYTKNESEYLYLMIQARFLSFFSSEKQSFFIREHYVEATQIYQLTVLTTKILKQEFYDFSLLYTKESICYFLSFHLYYDLTQHFLFEKQDKIEEFQSVYPKFFHKLNKTVSALRKQHTFFEKISTTTLKLRYFIILSTLISPIQEESKRYIYLITDYSFEKEKNLAKNIKQFFKDTYNLHIVHGRNSSSLIYAEIILSSAINQELFQQETCPVLMIDTMSSEELCYKIKKILKNELTK